MENHRSLYITKIFYFVKEKLEEKLEEIAPTNNQPRLTPFSKIPKL